MFCSQEEERTEEAAHARKPPAGGGSEGYGPDRRVTGYGMAGRRAVSVAKALLPFRQRPWTEGRMTPALCNAPDTEKHPAAGR